MEFNFRAVIRSNEAIEELSLPPSCKVVERNSHCIIVEKLDCDFKEMKKDLHLFYRTEAMDKPRLIYQKSVKDHPGYVALMAQFLPTFEAPAPPHVCPQKEEKKQDG